MSNGLLPDSFREVQEWCADGGHERLCDLSSSCPQT
jgi:hypothetical protein